MTYDQALEFIHSIPRFSKPGLRRVTMLLDRLGNPQNSLRFVHVAGTSGKGSTCTMLSHVLARAGYRTGLYVSPFVLDFRERMQIDNRMISREELVRSAERVRREWEALDAVGETPTELEVVAAIAFDYFARKRVDLVVLEVGMGGRFDSTNVIGAPLVSVITSIGYDHTEYLGETLTEIAGEKCGIIKNNPRGGVTVCYPRQPAEALAVIMRRAAEAENRLIVPMNAHILRTGLEGSDIRYGELELHIPLPGRHQVYNAITAVETLGALAAKGFPVSGADIVDGIASTRIPSRVEVLCREPLLILDGAHNLDKIKALGESLDLIGDRKIHAVMGMLANKDVAGSLAELLPRCASLTAVAQTGAAKAMPAEELAALARPLLDDVRVFEDPEEGVRAAWARCGKGDAMLVFGSLYLAGDLRPLLLELAAGKAKARPSAKGKSAPHRKRARK